MTTVPLHAPQQLRALKTAFRRLVHEVGGLEASASVTRVGTSQLADYYHPLKLEVWAPIDVVADLEEVAGQPIVTTEMARLRRHVLSPLPEGVSGDEAKAIAEALSEAARASVTFMQAMLDGALDDGERGALAAHLQVMLREGARALALVSGPELLLRKRPR